MSVSSAPARSGKTRIPFYRDTRVLAVLIQIVFVVAVITFFVWLFGNMFGNLNSLGISDFQQPFFKIETVNGQTSFFPWFRFLYSSAGFDILDTPISYTRQDTYLRALTVGIVNTIRVGIIGIVLSTILGVLTGIARLSSNWLLSKIALTYIEIIRNTPLLVQLFFWYFAGLLALPRLRTGGRGHSPHPARPDLHDQPRHRHAVDTRHALDRAMGDVCDRRYRAGLAGIPSHQTAGGKAPAAAAAHHLDLRDLLCGGSYRLGSCCRFNRCASSSPPSRTAASVSLAA